MKAKLANQPTMYLNDLFTVNNNNLHLADDYKPHSGTAYRKVLCLHTHPRFT